MQNPIETILRFQIFQVFFQKVNFFIVSTLYGTGEKNYILVLFYSAKSVSDHLTISKLFQVFFEKLFFQYFEPYTPKVSKKKSKKIFFSALL